MKAGGPVDRPSVRAAGFEVGDRVRTVNIHPEGHTRLPRYARARVGKVTAVLGFHVFPDSNALGSAGNGENPQWLYCVVLKGRDVWGPDADATLTVSIDAWESYLEPA